VVVPCLLVQPANLHADGCRSRPLRVLAHTHCLAPFHPSSHRYVLCMFSRLSLSDAFRHVASGAEWTSFLGYGAVTPTDIWIGSWAARSDPSACDLARYSALWTELAARVRIKLLSRIWTAEGFRVESGGQAIPIDAHLWRSLEFDIAQQAAVGAGFVFVNLLITSNEAGCEVVSQAKVASTRTRLLRWLEDLARSATGPMTQDEVYAAAVLEFGATVVSRNMLSTVWTQAVVPAGFRHKGRPSR
jgi:hypothetical protein